MIIIDERDYREALVGIGIDCRNEGAEATKDLLLLGTCDRKITHVLNNESPVCFMFCVLFCFIRWVGAELKPRNLVLGAGGAPDGAAGAGGAGAALVGAEAGAGADPPTPPVKATCGSVCVCVCENVVVCVNTCMI